LQKRSSDVAELYETAPLVVLNNFGAADAANPTSATAAVPAHIKLMRITFQNMCPALDVATVRLSECRYKERAPSHQSIPCRGIRFSP
jgi:ribosome biogenesis protein SSF1/2